ncbi:MAG TPA: hypothetical protein VJ802_07705 [Gemmatimonadaceae bacterium]|nr:hypothetical protein [Gemmatimonadaceae bacterium]
MDGSIAEWARWVLVAWLAGAAVYAVTRFGIVPKADHLRDPNSLPFMPPWRILSPEKWTPQGVAFNRRVLAFFIKTVAGVAALWIVFDLFT